MRDKILIIDDEPNLRMILEETLSRAGYLVYCFQSFALAKSTLNNEDIDLVLTDLQMPGENGMDVLAYCKLYSPELPVVLITAYGTIERAVTALKAGAFDFVLKPLENAELFRVIEKATQSRIRRKKEPALEMMSAVGVGPVPLPLFGESVTTRRLRQDVDRIAKTGSPIIMSGEVGTGMRSIAYEIHRKSNRARGPFIQINMEAIPPVFQQTELMGVERGSNPMNFFSKPGSFELAQGGTVLIEEVGELTFETQNAFFTALDQDNFSRLGGVKKFPLDFRIIATSSKNLLDRVKEGSFHVELFYKLSVESLTLLPLRDRREDIASHFVPFFVERACRKNGISKVSVSEEALLWFQSQAWTGNLGELERKVEKAVNLCKNGTIQLKDLLE